MGHWVGPEAVLVVALLLLAGSLPQQSSAQPTSRSIAVLEIPEDDGSIDPIKAYGARYLDQVTGVRHTVTTSIDSASNHALVIATSGIDETTFSASERETLRTYVAEGGVLLAGNFKDSHLFDLFGITGEDYGRGRHRVHFLKDNLPDTFAWIDESRERTISLGDPDRDLVALSRSYTPGEASVLARFDDGSPAFTKHNYGDGTAYLVGVALRDVTIRNQMNRDFTAQRSFSNGFEPSGDAFPLLVRSLYREHVPTAVRKHTAPLDNRSTLIITHDVDSETGMEWMNRFAEYEQAQGITVNYYITTHYVDDNLFPDYYTPYRDSVSKLHDQDQRIGSHSVGHFPDFDEFPFGTLNNKRAGYAPRYEGGETNGGTILGELEVSKSLLEEDVPQEVVSFRAGHLLYPDKLVNGLDTLDYKYNSTYSANTVLTSFPYRNVKGRTFSGTLSEVWEVPMTLSDVYANDPMTEENYPEKVDIWLDAHEKYAANGSPVVLLIHPNRRYKIDAEQSFVERLPSETAIVSTEAFGRYWADRLAAEIHTERAGDDLTIRVANRHVLPDSLSLMVDSASTLESITLQNEEGYALPHETSLQSNGQLLIHSASPASGDLKAEVSNSITADGEVSFGATGANLQFFGTEGRAIVTVQKFGSGPVKKEGISEQNVGDFRFVVTAGSDLSYDSTEVRLGVSSLSGVDTPDGLQIYKREEAGSGRFQALATSVLDNDTPGDLSDDTLSATVHSFGEFVLASDSSPLPVEMARFDAQADGEIVHLTWTTASESGNAGFEVQRRSVRVNDWHTLGFVQSKAAAGRTSEPLSYQYSDTELPYGADSLTYRLVQIDTDGSTHPIDPVTIERGLKSVQLLGTYPNPARQEAILRFAVPEPQDVSVHLFDLLGRRVRTVVDGEEEGRHELQLETSDLPSGVYFVRLQAEDVTRARKLTVVR